MKIKCIIVEDEPLAQARAQEYVQQIPFLELGGVFDNAMDALQFMKQHTVDLVFLDIHLGEISGIQLLEAADIRAEVIITTAYPEFALKGFELNVTDYLLKPYTFARFLQAVERTREQLARHETAVARDFIFVKTEYRLEKLLFSELLYIEGMRDYRRIHTTSKRIMTLQTFRSFEEELPASVACRVHKSFMVALQRIEAIERDMIRVGDKQIPVSETYRKMLFDRLNRS